MDDQDLSQCFRVIKILYKDFSNLGFITTMVRGEKCLGGKNVDQNGERRIEEREP